jgi:hypothetical protein
MTDISDEELRQRLAALESGPWMKGVTKARLELAPINRLKTSIGGSRPIALNNIERSRANIRKNTRLASVLRIHYAKGEKEITKQKEIATRDALDEALTLPQLYELAVQTGYLRVDHIKEPARKILTDLLWSSSARNFIAAYNYVAMPMLSNRVGVLGIGSAIPPEPNPNAALRFAGFLSHLRSFYDSEEIEIWTRFLDDYVEEKNEQNKLWEFLHGKKRSAPKRAQELLNGCQLFVSSLASAFYILDEDELGRFGLVHAYWLQQFFGYRKSELGYVKNTSLWGLKDSWANTITTSRYFNPEESDQEILRIQRQQLNDQVHLLEQTFDAVRSLSKSAQTTYDTKESALPTK